MREGFDRAEGGSADGNAEWYASIRVEGFAMANRPLIQMMS